MSLEFKITRDAQLLDQYYRLREQCYRSELGLSGFDGSEDEQDKHSDIMVALDGDRCVGGVRISSHITLTSQVEQLGLEKEQCCMWERFAINPVMRTLGMFREFNNHLVDASRDSGYDNAMVLSSLANARFYRRCHSALGVKFQIHRQVPHCAQGIFSGLEHYLSVAHLEPRNKLQIAV
ncbi:Uncharacterised protein [Halioglobus japonicus]|nr:Uncharacterised protein [Halioglobus japonicus]